MSYADDGYAEIARRDFERKIYEQCDREDAEHEQAYEHFTEFVDCIIQQCDEFSATVQEGSKLLTEARENLSKALCEMSVTGELAKIPCPYCGAPTGAAEPDAFCGYWNHGGMYCIRHPENLREAERKHYANQHRLEQEYDMRFPEE